MNVFRRSIVRLAAALLVVPQLARAQEQAPAPAPTSAQIPVEDFAQLPFLSGALLSPDGTRIAARVSGGGVENIAIWTVGSEADPRMIRATGSESFEWAGDNRLLVTTNFLFAVAYFQTVLPVRVQRVESHDLETGNRTPLGRSGFIQDVIFVDPLGRYALVSSQGFDERSPQVLRVDLANGESVEVQPAVRGVSSWFADAEGVVRVGVDYGERRTRIHYRPNAGSPLTLVDTRRNLNDDSVVDMVRFITDAGTDRGLIVTNADTGRFAIYDYDFATDTRGDVLFAHPEVDVTRGIYARNGGLDGVQYEDDRPRVHWRNADMQRVQAAIDRTIPDHTNLVINSSRDGNRVLIFSTAAHDPGTYYVYDQAARRLERFASPYDALIDNSFAEVRPIRFQSRDGLTLNGYLTVPPGGEARGLPLVVLPHGGPFARDSWSFSPEVQFLASRGYAVLQVNFRGSTGYGREFVERGYGQLGGGMINDLEDGIDWLVQQNIVDRGRVCIMGSSYGGYAAIWAAMRSPDRYRCAISFAGPTDLRAMLRHDRRFFFARRYAREWQRRVEGEERTDLNAVSPARHPEMLRIPLLLAHGENDTNVPPDQSRRLIRALERARNTNVESVFYPKAGHGFNDAAESADYMRRVEAFLLRHNPAAAAAAPVSASAAGPAAARP